MYEFVHFIVLFVGSTESITQWLLRYCWVMIRCLNWQDDTSEVHRKLSPTVLEIDTCTLMYLPCREPLILDVEEFRPAVSCHRTFHTIFMTHIKSFCLAQIGLSCLEYRLKSMVSYIYLRVIARSDRKLYLGPNPKGGGLQSCGVRPTVCHRFLVRVITFERKVIETWL